jgi:hypothetical protein
MPQRVIATIATLVVSAWAAGPAHASGGPLLSGYGGPGEGAQAILGSTLIGGSGENPGSGASGGDAGGLAGPGAGVGVQGRRSSGAGRPVHAGAPAGRVVGNSHGRVETTQNGSSQAQRAGFAASQTSADGSQPLGLSGEDFAYMLLALALLAFTGVLTRSLARRQFR